MNVARTVSIDLSDRHADLLAAELSQGHASDAAEIVARRLELALSERDRLAAKLAALRQEVEVGGAELDRGEITEQTADGIFAVARARRR